MTKCLLGLIAIFVLSGCSSSSLILERPDLSTVDTLGEYRIGVGDELRINVWKNAELSMSVPVRPDGKISLPLIGDIEARGLSANELSRNITKSLETYLRSPQVGVIVTNAGSVDYLLRVRVTGAVDSPLSLPHKDGMTVLDLVLEAGGPTQYASSNRAKLYRKVDGQVKIYPIKLHDILNKGKLDTNYLLAPSDIVTVPERLF
ncbi:XrtA/PEP-CTERM system exopolysaccharide export protein [Agarilytica rhodophyticola]|uniref:XrtA/PEP-CTERM system exopolysaccharide export protein n=1 Tax=Agarilytica rhodophyticola TaxID=1737490 RepID=UPI000B3419BE|nr:XrtA/PEP-CTERM system exopolysaccharide export protein [Agarilytica rhodophyticola]